MKKSGAFRMRVSSRSLASSFAIRPTAKASPLYSRPLSAALKPELHAWPAPTSPLQFGTAIAFIGMSAFTGQAAEDKKALQAPCVEDAMIVFDASGSASGRGVGGGRGV